MRPGRNSENVTEKWEMCRKWGISENFRREAPREYTSLPARATGRKFWNDNEIKTIRHIHLGING